MDQKLEQRFFLGILMLATIVFRLSTYKENNMKSNY